MADGTPGDDYLWNEDAVNHGFDGNDIIFSKLLSGNAYMDGGNGNDILALRSNSTAALEAWGGSGDDWLGSHGGADSLFGGEGEDLVEGGGGNDFLSGGSDVDGLYGSDGADSLFGADGNDTRALVTIDLQTDTLSFYAGLYGGAGNDSLDGGAGDDWLDGGTGNDKMTGGTGNDTFLVDSYYDRALERPGEGHDVVTSANFEFILESGQEIEELRAAADGAHRNLYGNEFGQMLIGNDGGNSLDGGGGTDIFYGGKGYDRYIVDSMDDRVYENVGEGYDSVGSWSTYVLAAGQEIESLSAILGAGSLNLTGNEFNQGLYGNEGTNVLRGQGGHDSLYGGAGDMLYGGTGNDFYLIETGVPMIFENMGEGAGDTVRTRLETYALPAGAEIELLGGVINSGEPLRNFMLTGNGFAQVIVGEAGNDLLSDGGGAGVDTLQGLGGNDTYRIGNRGAIIEEVAGGGVTDRILVSFDYALKAGVQIEVLATNSTASTTGVDLTGNELAQTVNGNAGDNILDGKGGNDRLIGLGGKDFFVFSTALGTGNVDTIADFSVVDDTIRLENAVFTKLAVGDLNVRLLRASSDAVALDANDFILYDTDDGKLYYDSDGSGAGVRMHFATLTGAPSVTNADFVVI